MDDGFLALKWNNHKATFFHVLSRLREKEVYTDATLACEGKFFPVHKLVMSMSSDYFSVVFENTPCKSPVVILKDIRYQDLQCLLDYMYLGEVEVRQSELPSLIHAAECLKIKGLAVPDEEQSSMAKKTYAPNHKDSPVSKKKKQTSNPTKISDGLSYILPTKDFEESIEKPGSAHLFSVETIKLEIENDKEQDIIGLQNQDGTLSGIGLLKRYETSNIETTSEKCLENDFNGFGEHNPEIQIRHSDRFETEPIPGTSGTHDEASIMRWGDKNPSIHLYGEDSMPHPFAGHYLDIHSGSPLNLSGPSLVKKKSRAVCTLCSKTFPFQYLLRRHMRKHTQEKPFACTQCPYRSNNSYPLRIHIMKKHSQAAGLTLN